MCVSMCECVCVCVSECMSVMICGVGAVAFLSASVKRVVTNMKKMKTDSHVIVVALVVVHDDGNDTHSHNQQQTPTPLHAEQVCSPGESRANKGSVADVRDRIPPLSRRKPGLHHPHHHHVLLSDVCHSELVLFPISHSASPEFPATVAILSLGHCSDWLCVVCDSDVDY